MCKVCRHKSKLSGSLAQVNISNISYLQGIEQEKNIAGINVRSRYFVREGRSCTALHCLVWCSVSGCALCRRLQKSLVLLQREDFFFGDQPDSVPVGSSNESIMVILVLV